MNTALTTPVLESTDAAITAALTKAGIALEGVATLRAAFAPHFQELEALTEQARAVKNDEPAAARRVRLAIRAVRIAAEKTHEGQKADILRHGRAVDGVRAVLLHQAEPLEELLGAIEKAEEVREAKRKADLRTKRAELLSPYVDPETMAAIDLTMADGLWTAVFAGFKVAHEARVAAEAKAQADKVAAEALAAAAELKRKADEAAERERLRAENERLARVAAEERKARDEAEALAVAERQRAAAAAEAEKRKAEIALAEVRRLADEKAAKEKAERDAADIAAANTKKLSDAKMAAETKRQNDERDRQQEIARQERVKREAAEAEVKRLKDAEWERVAAAFDSERKAKAAPDREKVAALAKQIRALSVPTLATATGSALAARINEQVAKFAAWLDAEAGKI